LRPYSPGGGLNANATFGFFVFDETFSKSFYTTALRQLEVAATPRSASFTARATWVFS